MVGRHIMDDLDNRLRMNYYQQKMGVSDLVLKIQHRLCWLTFQKLWNTIYDTEWIETLRYDAIGGMSRFRSIGLCIARPETVDFQPPFWCKFFMIYSGHFTQYQHELRRKFWMQSKQRCHANTIYDAAWIQTLRYDAMGGWHVLFTFAHGLQGEKQSVCLVQILLDLKARF
eukprot:721247_1